MAAHISKRGSWRNRALMIPFLMSFILFKVSNFCSSPCGRFSMMHWNHWTGDQVSCREGSQGRRASSPLLQGIICIALAAPSPKLVHTHYSPSRKANSWQKYSWVSVGTFLWRLMTSRSTAWERTSEASSASEPQRNVKGNLVEIQVTCSSKHLDQLIHHSDQLGPLDYAAMILLLLGQTIQDNEDIWEGDGRPRQLHGYDIPTWVMGMGTMWVWVWVWSLHIHTHTHTHHVGMVGISWVSKKCKKLIWWVLMGILGLPNFNFTSSSECFVTDTIWI